MARDTPHSDAAAGNEEGAKATPACSGASSQTLSQPPESASHPNQVTELLAGAAAVAHRTCLPASFSHRVPHYRQMHTWDCGVACVLMVLRALGSSRHHWGTLLELCPTHSIWTIDLAHLLAVCGARCQLATVTLGANQAYSGAGFYAEHIQQDSARVERLFRTAAAAGIGLACRSVTLGELSRLLLGGSCLVIALVDRRTLDSPSCGSTAGVGGSSTAGGGGGSAPSTDHPTDQQPVAAAAPAVIAAMADVGAASVAAAAAAAAGSNETVASTGGHEPEQEEGSEEQQGGEAAAYAYVGHFIVLCGYDSGTHAFEMRDPASHRERQWVPAARLEAARKRFGTDEDLLLVEAPPPDAETGAEAAAPSAAAAGATAAAAAAQQAGSAAACATATALR